MDEIWNCKRNVKRVWRDWFRIIGILVCMIIGRSLANLSLPTENADSLRYQQLIPVDESLRAKVFYPFPAIVVMSERQSNPEEKIPRFISRINAVQLQDEIVMSTPDALAELPGLMVQKTNLGGGSPFIRGLTGKQILILVDGVRLNNSTFRFGPNQYLNTLDPGIAEAMEVHYGPGSVIHGSDALGGVINIISKAPSLNESLHACFRQQFSSADLGSLSNLEIGAATGKLAWLAGVSYKHFGDLRAGSNGGSPVGVVDKNDRQPWTGYDEFNTNLSLLYALRPNQHLRNTFIFTRQGRVPRTDKMALTDYNPDPEERYYFDPQQLIFNVLEFSAIHWKGLNQIGIQVGLQSQLEGRERRKAGWTKTRFEEDEIRTFFLQFQGSDDLNEHQWISFGSEFYHDFITSERYEINDGTTLRKGKTGRFPDGSDYNSLGAYLQSGLEFGTSWEMIGGLRYAVYHTNFDLSAVKIDTIYREAEESLVFNGGVNEKSYSDFTWSLETLYRIRPGRVLYAGLSRGFRAPNMDDLAVDGEWNSGTDIPNPELKPEKALQMEGGVKIDSDKLRLRCALFHTRYSDFIQRQYLGYRVEEGAEVDVYHYENFEKGVMDGFEMQLAWRFQENEAHRTVLQTHASWIRGWNETSDEPMRRMPPLMAYLGLRRDFLHSRTWIEGFAQAAGKQDQLAAGDIVDNRIPDGGTPGWMTLNLRSGWQISRHLEGVAGLYNILDARYRIYGSGLDAPGINAVFSISYR